VSISIVQQALCSSQSCTSTQAWYLWARQRDRSQPCTNIWDKDGCG